MKLPDVFTRLYLEVANGGFGPGYGLWGLISGYSDQKNTVVSFYERCSGEQKEGYENWIWPRSKVVVSTWGCAEYNCLDFSSESVPVYRFLPGNFVPNSDVQEEDEAPSRSLEEFFSLEFKSILEWLNAWLDGKVKQ